MTNPQLSAAFFAARLACQTDASDVHAALESGTPGFALIDSRGIEGWSQGHIPGALHLTTADIPTEAPRLLDQAVPVVTYCWGPGCNGATRAALALAQLGFQVKEMLGGIEYWQREGFRVETADRVSRREAPDPLTAPVGAVSCAC